jgi:hypothetical protein
VKLHIYFQNALCDVNTHCNDNPCVNKGSCVTNQFGFVCHCLAGNYLQFMYASTQSHLYGNHIGGVMVCVLTSSVVDRRFESRLDQTKDYKLGICCFSAKHTVVKNEVHFVLDQHAELDYHSASSLKQQSADRHVAPLRHTILILSFQSLLFLFTTVCLAEKQQIPSL